jgi:hypothetical protein
MPKTLGLSKPYRWAISAFADRAERGLSLRALLSSIQALMRILADTADNGDNG